MPKILVIGTEEFSFPLEGESGNYGESVTSWAEAVSTALGTVQQRNDIPITTATILNNITLATAIPGFSFDTSEVVSVNCEYIVKRTTVVPAVTMVESGIIRGNFDGSNWYISIESERDAGINFDITPAGQVTYTTTDMTGTSYAGSILFKAKVFNKTEE